MPGVKISRLEKNLMRSQLEKVLELQQDIKQKIDAYQQETNVHDYKKFWQELGTLNKQNMQVVSRFMVRKCNR